MSQWSKTNLLVFEQWDIQLELTRFIQIDSTLWDPNSELTTKKMYVSNLFVINVKMFNSFLQFPICKFQNGQSNRFLLEIEKNKKCSARWKKSYVTPFLLEIR